MYIHLLKLSQNHNLRKIFKYILIAFGLLLTISCIVYYSNKNPGPKASNLPNDKAERYYGSLKSYSDFVKLSGEPLSKKFNDVISIKVVYKIRTGNLYFINSAKYLFHYQFCNEVLGFKGDLLAFNHSNYGDNLDQEYYLANINYYRALNKYALEFTSSTRYSAKQIKELFNIVTENSYFKDSLNLLVSSDFLNNLDKNGELNLPKIYPSQIYKGQKYQALQTGISYGILKEVNDLEKEYTQIKPQDIIIIKGTPINVPLCQGIITNDFQTPFSHINALCHNRKIPAAADIKIWNKDFDKLIGKPVKLIVSDTGINILPTTLDKLTKFLKSKNNIKPQNLSFNLTEKRLLLVSQFTLESKKSIGNKAAGFGELYKIVKRNSKLFKTPEAAFAIPFFYYNQHISNTAIKKEIDKLFKNSIYTQNTDSLKKQLKRIRKTIKDEPINTLLYNKVCAIIKENNMGNSYRFRSSSNAEDAENFSGAGLYESKTGILGDDKKSIDKAIKAVWASAWKYEAFAERQYFGINHLSMKMGILVHKNFEDEASNGVVITKNLYREDFGGFTVNVQKGEVSVVSPPDGVTCEQFVCTASSDMDVFSGGVNIDYITYSSISGNAPLLTKKQIEVLFNSLSSIKMHFYKKTYWGLNVDYNNFGLDIEFKFDKTGMLYVKQVRAYN